MTYTRRLSVVCEVAVCVCEVGVCVCVWYFHSCAQIRRCMRTSVHTNVAKNITVNEEHIVIADAVIRNVILFSFYTLTLI